MTNNSIKTKNQIPSSPKGKTFKGPNIDKINKRLKKELRFDSKVQLARLYRIVNSLFIQLWQVNKQELVDLAAVFVKIGRIWKTSGLKFTIAYMKSVRLHCTRYMVGQPLILKGTQSVRVSLDSDYFPKILSKFKYLFRSESAGCVERGLTLLSISRAFRRSPKNPIEIDLSSIYKKHSGTIKTLNDSLLKKVIGRMTSSRLRVRDLTEEDLIIFNSAGPHGPSTATCFITLAEMKEYLFGSLLTLTGEWGKTYLKSARLKAIPKPYIPLFGNFPPKVHEGGWASRFQEPNEPWIPSYVRRLAMVEDPELKARVVAIFDHFSQIILNVLSKQMFNILRTIPSDRTFTQSPFFDHEGYVKTDDKYHSLDLTAATDRFPLPLQLQVLHHFGLTELECSAWSKVMVAEPFVIPKNWGVADDPVWYAVGQPMGARSSWPAFTLTHHVLVRYCAWQLGMKDFHNYIILGDDIVIHNDQVAKYYRTLMGRLGVELSENKTHSSLTHWEFAKRWIYLGKEISGIPISGISDNLPSLGTILQIFYEIIITRNRFQIIDFKNWFSKWYSSLSRDQFSKKDIKILKVNPFGKFKTSSCKSIIRRINPFIFLLRFKGNLTTYDEKRNFLATELGPKEEKGSVSMIPPSNRWLDIILSDTLNLILKEKINNTLTKSNLLLDEILSQQERFPEDYPSHLIPVDPVLTGLEQIRKRLISVTSMHLDNPFLHVKETMNIVFSYENDLFTNREGSSKAKRFHNFNKLALAFSSRLRRLVEPPKMANFTSLFGSLFSIAQVKSKEIKYRSKYRE